MPLYEIPKHTSGKVENMHALIESMRGMATTRRHAELNASISGGMFAKYRKRMFGKKPSMQGLVDFALVYYGESGGPLRFFNLVDLSEVEDQGEFVETINDLEYFKPDFMLFHKNPYLYNKRQTKIAGQPDLIVEIWSKSDTPERREFKQLIYSSSPVTEHWYFKQNSNTVSCFIGKNPLPDQHLGSILITQMGIQFDLRHLALEQ